MEFIKKILRPIIPLSRIGAFIRDRKKWLQSYACKFVIFYPVGHFYSPIPDIDEIRSNRERLFARDRTTLAEIDLRAEAQLGLAEELSVHAQDWQFPVHADGKTRYHAKNPVFEIYDGMILFSLMRHFRPRRILEVGSGFSSALMLDTDNLFFAGETRFGFIDPNPERLHSLLSDRDRESTRIQEKKLQEADLGAIDELEENDIFFVDTSHVVKIGGEVNEILFEVLPRIRPGVLIHFHDIYWPFEYPEKWVELGRAWNEAYVLRAFLQNNRKYEILFFNSYMKEIHGDRMLELFPEIQGVEGGSLWLRKVA